MRLKILLPLLMAACFAKGQDTTSFQKLVFQFSQAYIESSDKNPSNNYFGNLQYATGVLDVYNEKFRLAKSGIKKTGGQPDDETTIRLLTDSVITTFTAQSFWKGYEAEFKRYLKLIKLYTDRACPCYTTKLHNTNKDLNVVVKECEDEVTGDKEFMTRLSVYLAELPAGERTGIQKFASMYTYQNCEAINTSMNNMLIDEVVSKYNSHMFDLAVDADQKLVHYFTKGIKDSLVMLYPEFQKSAGDIKNAASLYKDKINSSTSTDFKDGQTVFTKYFTDSKKIFGKVSYSYVVKNDEIKITSFQFTPANKITIEEKRELMDRPKEVLPPVEDEKR
jgi:hypothetical protein